MPDLPESLDGVIEQIRSVLDEPEEALGPDDDLFAAGLDSIRLMQLTDRWAQAGLTVDPMTLLDDPTPAGFWSAISRARNGA